MYRPNFYESTCLRCRETVYQVDRIGPLKDFTFFHTGCFKCRTCGSKLTLKTYFNNQHDQDDKEVSEQFKFRAELADSEVEQVCAVNFFFRADSGLLFMRSGRACEIFNGCLSSSVLRSRSGISCSWEIVVRSFLERIYFWWNLPFDFEDCLENKLKTSDNIWW